MLKKGLKIFWQCLLSFNIIYASYKIYLVEDLTIILLYLLFIGITLDLLLDSIRNHNEYSK